MRILLAEDDKKLGKLIVHMLQKEKYTVDWVLNGKEAYEYATIESYELLLLDWMLPGMNGVDICRTLRQSGYQGGILLLTARDALDDRVYGLDAGADDYLIKPFAFEELFARLRALLRRRQLPLSGEIIQIGNFTLHCTERTLQKENDKIQLTPREFQLMELLARNRGHIVPRDVILDRIWGYDADVTSNTLDAFIRLLRKKIARLGGDFLIRNVRGTGYKIEV